MTFKADESPWISAKAEERFANCPKCPVIKAPKVSLETPNPKKVAKGLMTPQFRWWSGCKAGRVLAKKNWGKINCSYIF